MLNKFEGDLQITIFKGERKQRFNGMPDLHMNSLRFFSLRNDY